MFDGIVDFAQKVGALKNVKRSGWISWVGIENPESVADHSFRCAVLAMCLADLKGLDAEKLMRMVLLHDVHEALIGDYDYFAKREIGEGELRQLELEAINKIVEKLPEKLRDKYLSLWLEFTESRSPETKIAKQIDRLEMVMQALEYEKEGYDKRRLAVFWENVKQKLEDEDLRKIFELLENKKD